MMFEAMRDERDVQRSAQAKDLTLRVLPLETTRGVVGQEQVPTEGCRSGGWW